MRQAAIALMAIAVAVILLGYLGMNPLGLIENEGGQAGHLGGAILGFFLIRFPWLLGFQRGMKTARSKVVAPPPLAKLRPRSELETKQDTAMDLILDKISREGFQSLTPEERDFLQKASSHKNPT